MQTLMLGLVCAVWGFAGEPGGDGPGWPQWRGPTHDAISRETGIANAWPKEGPPVLWVQEIGQGYSGFIAVGDKVFTQTQTLYEQAVICLESDTGRSVWSYRYGWPYDGGGLYPGPRATPAWHQGRIYYAAPDGTIGCLNAADGKLVWSKNPKQQYHGQGTDFGCACSPLIVDGKVIVPVGGRTASVVALDATNGETVWVSGDLAASYCTPVPIMFQGRQQVVTFMENSLAAFDVQSGRRLWNLEFSQGYDEHAAAPLYREPDLMIASPFRSGAKLFRISGASSDALPKAGAPNGGVADAGSIRHGHSVKEVWENAKFSNDVASSLLLEGHVFGFDLKDAQSRLNRPSRGEYRCLDFATGKILWSTDKVGQANVIAADGKLILFNDNGELILAKADAERYVELARTTVFRDEVCWTPAALHRGRLYLRTQSRAVCLYLGDKPLKTESATPARSTASVAGLRPTRWFKANTLLGSEREFPATTPEWDEFSSWYWWSLGALPVGALVGLVLLPLLGLARRVRLSRQRISNVAQPPHPQPLAPEYGGEGSQALHDIAQKPLGLAGSNTAASSAGASPSRSRSQPGSSWVITWRVGFWLTLFFCGACGSAVLNPRLDNYLFTWPLALWVVLQLTLMTISWCERQPDKRQARWWSRGAGLLLLASSAFYFHVCRSLGLSIEWSYLLGFLPGFPIAALCARPLTMRHRYWLLADPALAAVSFTAYFWACAWFMKWWLVVGS